MRRSIGPPYERSPAERLGRWIMDNLMVVISAIIVAVVFCFIVDMTVNKLFNFLQTNGHDELQGTFSSSDPIVDAVKVIGSITLIYVICRRKAK